jgi:hypothetical protein
MGNWNSKIIRYYLQLFLLILIGNSCQQSKNGESKDIAFYHWKSDANYSTKIHQTLVNTKSKKVYMHYFDVDQTKSPTHNDNGIYPTYVLKDIDEDYADYNIIPVIYITNQVFKSKDLNIIELVNQIKKLINQISQKHFKKELKQIQIDCDWSQSTKNIYFEFLSLIKNDFDIDVTIRLHQIKYKEKTGIPPVEHGTLMLYNMGDLKNNNQNSILESSIVKQYINNTTHYPINLHLGLPIFSQTILSNNDKEYKIIKNCDRELFEKDDHFTKIDDNNFKVVEDTLYKGFYLTKGFNLKLEEINQNEIVNSYKIIKQSELNIDEIIFYHLDDESLKNVNIETIIKAL